MSKKRRGAGWAIDRAKEWEKSYNQWGKWDPPTPRHRGAKAPETLMVRVEIRNEFWEGWAVWRRKDNVWGCMETSETCRFLRGKNRDEAKLELLRRGCRWEAVK